MNLIKKFFLFLTLPFAWAIECAAIALNLQMSVKAQNYPSLAEMARNLAIDTGAIEVIKWEFYDYLLYPTAGVAGQLGFFLTGQGQGQSTADGSAAGAVKTIADTNMTGAGVLPSPQAFWSEEIEFVVEPGSVATANTFTRLTPSTFLAVPTAAGLPQFGEVDVNAILTTGAFVYSVSGKPFYNAAPLHRAPPSTRVQIDAAVSSNSATTGAVVKGKAYASGEKCVLDPGVGIMSAQNFGVAAIWPFLVPTVSGFNARVGCILSGYLFRGI